MEKECSIKCTCQNNKDKELLKTKAQKRVEDSGRLQNKVRANEIAMCSYNAWLILF